MSYINAFERELRTRLAKGSNDEDIAWVRETVVQSYRNGLEVGMQADKNDVRKAQKFSRSIKQ